MKQVADQLRDGRGLAVAALVAGMALLLAACGGSSDATGQGTESSSFGGTTTKVVLIKRGDAICRRTDELQQQGLVKFERSHPGWTRTPAGIETLVLQVALPPIKSEILQLAALGAPEAEKEKVSEFIKAMDKALHAAESNPQSIAKFEGPFSVPGEMAAAYGFLDCSRPL